MNPELREYFLDHYKARLNKYKNWSSPPWAARKNHEVIKSVAHPDLQRDLGILLRCRPSSIMAIHSTIIEYFVKTYQISVDMSESWVLFTVTRDMEAIMPMRQIDGVRFFNDEDRAAGPYGDATKEYDRLQADIKQSDAYVNIRIGRSASKTDVLWLIEHYWDDWIAPRIATRYAPKPQKMSKTKFRNSVIYALINEGMKVKEIQRYVSDNFDEIVDESTIRKIPKEYTPPRNWFAPAIATMRALEGEDRHNAEFNIVFEDAPEPCFRLIKQ